MNILITGGAGFIGSHLTRSLSQDGHSITILDNFSKQIHGAESPIQSAHYNNLKNYATVIVGDVCDSELVSSLATDQDCIVHLAAETGTGQSMYELMKYNQVNVMATSSLLDFLSKGQHRVKNLVLASSRAVYGEGQYYCNQHLNVYPESRSPETLKNSVFEPVCPHCSGEIEVRATEESARLHPTSIYGLTKLNQEQLVVITCRSIGLKATALRFQNVYGPGQSLKNPYTGILSIFSTAIRNKNPIYIFEDGLESRDFVYIDDVVKSLKLAINKSSNDVDILNIGSGTPTTVGYIVNQLIAQLEGNVPVTITGDFRVGDIRHNYACLAKAHAILDFEPQHHIEDGLKHFVSWVTAQNIHVDRYEESLNELRNRGLLGSTD